MRDIPDINVYRIKVNGLSQNLYNEVGDQSIARGEFFYVYYDYNYTNDFFNNSGPSNDFKFSVQNRDQMGNLNSQLTGSTEVILEVRPSISSSDWTEVDKIEASSEDSYDQGFEIQERHYTGLYLLQISGLDYL